MKDQALIELRNICKNFGNVEVLKNVSLSIKKGSFITLLGPSGCGKTTLLRTLAGFYGQDGGDIFIGGKCMNGVPPENRRTPLVFQDYALFPHMNIAENIGYGLRLQHRSKKEIAQRIQEQLAIFNLEGLENRFPRQLSGGQQQRVAFARALVMGYDILLLDEPLSNLDAKLRVEVRDELRKIQKKTGMTTIYVTHDQEEALAMSDMIAVMNHGEIVQTGTPHEIYFQPVNRFVADFIGSVNLVPVEQYQIDGDLATLKILGISGQIQGRPLQGPLKAVLRPERVMLCEASQGDLTGVITDALFLGRMIRYTVEACGTALIVDSSCSNRDYEAGETVGICLDWKKLQIIEEGP